MPGAVRYTTSYQTMHSPITVLLQTTIPFTEDDWSIARFSCLREYLSSLTDDAGAQRFRVIARDMQRDGQEDDPTLVSLAESDIDELWLFAVDTGEGLTTRECEGITAFRNRGGGLLTTRDHMDLGSSLCTLGGVGAAHFFHSKQQEPDQTRHAIDDPYTTDISWPNYHSGSNGDYQKITPLEPLHELLGDPSSPTGAIGYLPSHPHEGAVGAPADDPSARVIASGSSIVSGQAFNLIVAFERGEEDGKPGRAIADSSFHHFVDYNWDPSLGAPSFVKEPPGDAIRREPHAMADTLTYVRNLADWLAPLKS